jgi:peptidyl-prolyl cis-trans isomerase D
MRQQIIESVWNNEIDQIILEEEYKHVGISFTDNDKEDGIYGENAPNELKESFKDPKTGQYDPEAARQQLKKILKSGKESAEKEQLINYINETVIIPGLRNKYLNLVKGSVYYPKWLHDKETVDQQSIASMNYVNIPYTSIGDSTIKISDEDIKAYIQKNKEQFKQDKSVSISYVVFDGTPTNADSLKTMNELIQKKEEFSTKSDVNSFLTVNGSESRFDDAYVMKSKLNTPAGDSLFNLIPNAVYGPYLDATDYTLAKFIDKKILPDSVKCRHILISTKPKEDGSSISDSVAKLRADSISLAINSGAIFGDLAAKLSDDPGSKDKGGEYSFSLENFAGLAKPFAEYIFYESAGSKSVIKTEFGYHYIEVLEHKNPGEAYKFAFFKRKIISSQETSNYASGEAMKFASSSTDKSSFEKTCKDNKLTSRVAEFKTSDYTLVGIGNARPLIKWAFENKVGAVSETENIEDYIVIATITEKNEDGLMSVKSARPIVEPILLNIKKAQQIIAKVGNQKELTAIAGVFKLNVERADSISFGSQFIKQIGAEPKLTGAAFNEQYKSKVSQAIAGNSGVFYIQVINSSMLPSTGESYESKRLQAELNIKNSISYKSIESIKRTAKIEDNRIQYY